MAASLNGAVELFRNINPIWLGYKFVLAAYASKINLNQISNTLGYMGSAVSEVTLPTAVNELREIPTLGHRKVYIPVKTTVSDLVIRAPVTRDNFLWNKMRNSIDVLDGFSEYETVFETLLLAEYESNSLIDALPLTLWVFEGCQPRSFKPASANAQGAVVVPLDELTFQVNNIGQITSL